MSLDYVNSLTFEMGIALLTILLFIVFMIIIETYKGIVNAKNDT